MKYLYFDLVGGISGDMIVASLLDITKGFTYLKKELKKINLKQYKIMLVKCQSGHINSHRFVVQDLAKNKRVFQLSSINNKIKESRLNPITKKKIIEIYESLNRAEKRVHGSNHVHFQQIGEVDSLVDIASACILIDKLGVDNVLYSRIPFGERVAPATALMLKSKEIYLSNHEFENITPTGIAIITALGKQKAENIHYNLLLERVGYGIGSVKSENLKNVLRAVIFRSTKRARLKNLALN